MGPRQGDPIPRPDEPKQPLRGPEWAREELSEELTNDEISAQANTIRVADDT
jgi:hypothetical protein